MKPRLTVVATSRSDAGIMAGFARRAVADPRFDISLVLTGSCEDEGEQATAPWSELLASVPDSIGRIPTKFLAERLTSSSTAVLMGDRFELLEVATAVLYARCPLVHLSGGEQTGGAMDDLVRDAISRLANGHCVSHRQAAERLRQRGENAKRIVITGDPALDAVTSQVERRVDGPIVVALHPVTRDRDETLRIVDTLATVMSGSRRLWVLTTPNSDPDRDLIDSRWRTLAQTFDHVTYQDSSLGIDRFRDLIAGAGVCVGNSSAGLIEVPLLGVGSLDLGNRQAGRLYGTSVVRIPKPTAESVITALDDMSTTTWRAEHCRASSPYGDGDAWSRILDAIALWLDDPEWVVKR